jgi:hypothetical protein
MTKNPTAEQLKRWHRNYYLKNKEYVNQYNGTKVECELCGAIVQRSYLRGHQKTKKCMKQRVLPKGLEGEKNLKEKND